MIYKTVDLFAGIGGIRRGYEMTGRFKNVLSAEYDKYACATYQHLYGEDPTNDVTSEEFKKKISITPYDVLLAGFPCQAFSRAGNQQGFLDSTRGTLFFDVADIIKRTRPKGFLLENVDNLLSHDKGNTFRTILQVLINELNYHIVGVEKTSTGELTYSKHDFMRNSRNFGVPQNRPRIYIMGFDKNKYEAKLQQLPKKTLPTKRAGKPIYADLNDLLEFNADPKYYIAQGYLDSLKQHRDRHEGKGNGFGYIVVNHPSVNDPHSNAVLATGGSGKERNIVYDPQEGISGLTVKGKQTPLNDEHLRTMTPREWGKLQGFIGYGFVGADGEDTFSFPANLSNAQRYKQFGNSVTIPVIEQMAKHMAECFDFLEAGQ